MGSSNRDGQAQGPEGRGGKRRRRRGGPGIESLEGRVLLTGNTWKPTTTDLTDVRNGPMANEGQDLINVYQTFLKAGDATSLAAKFPLLQFSGNDVAVQVRSNGTATLAGFTASLKNLGLNVSNTNPGYNLVSGYLPVSALPAVAALPSTLAASPIYRPVLNYQGVANNEADASLNANTVRTASGLTGAGVTVGAISDSFSQFAGGYADSLKTGDLPPGVINLRDDTTAGQNQTDEGRAMLENVHDIAPGSGLAFALGGTPATATAPAALGDPSGFAASIQALANTANAKVIVDDLSLLDDPVFQDGIVQQAVNSVEANNNVSYFSAADNFGPGAGYLSNFRGTQATIAGIGTGTFMNFAPSGAAVTQLPITTTAANQSLVLNFDQPDALQEPAGVTAGPTSEVDFYVLNGGGAVVASGVNNNVATGAPLQDLTIPAAGSYTVAIFVRTGANPGHVEFNRFGETPLNGVTVSTEFGSAGGTSYPSSRGHNVQAATIGVGAVPWWASSPFLNANPLNSEPFSATGPALTVLSPAGTPIAPTLTLNPTVTGPDGGNTSFFPPGQVIFTNNPPFPGEPATPTNLSQDLPSFFGTSSAAPNLAAVAALLKQYTPSLTNEQIRQAMIAGARPMNGSPAGTWNAQAGYGLVDASAALSSIQNLTVVSTTPPNNAVVVQTPTQIVVTFSRPVLIGSLSAADLRFTGVPAGVSGLTVGNPVPLDNAATPTQVAFPISFQDAPNTIIRGGFLYTISGPITAINGKTLAAPYTGSFNLNDIYNPKVVNVTVNGRVVTVQFSEPLEASTVTPSTVFVDRTDAAGRLQLNLNSDSRARFSYNAATSTVTLDYTGLDQTELTTGFYNVIVRAGDALPGGGFDLGVTDLAGLKLDGAFSGTFPSGNGRSTASSNFVDPLGLQTLSAPVITSLRLVTAYDTGIVGDENTYYNMPQFVGQVSSAFPGTLQGLTVYAEFSGLHGGDQSLSTQNGRGSNGTVDVQVSTNADGTFLLNAPTLPEGFQRVRLVVVGQPDSPPLPGRSSTFDHAFRVDETAPKITRATLAPGDPAGLADDPASRVILASLTTLSLDATDPTAVPASNFNTPAQVLFPALDPTAASNISNYSLTNTSTNTDASQFISTATFIPTASDYTSAPNRTLATDPYFGRIDLTFSAGLPAGLYTLTAHTKEGVYSGLTDAAGNPLDQTTAGQATKDYKIYFNIQPQPAFVTSVYTDVNNAQGNTALPRSYYEINPRAGDIVSAPPTTFYVDFSNPLNPATVNANSVQLVRSANAAGGTPDGEFGTLGEAGLQSSGTGFTRVNPAGTTLTVQGSRYGGNTEIKVTLPAGTTLPADYYRLYIPNAGATRLVDIYGNQVDGEFTGNPTGTGADLNGDPAYQDLLPTGQYRAGLSGDGVAGGAFMTGFAVLPSGNLLYARPDYVEDPLLPSTTSNGSLAQPYTVLAPQSAANGPGASTFNNGDPNGGENAAANFLTGFNTTYDRAGIGRFARSAFYAASQLSRVGPVVVVALPGTPQRDPLTGLVSQQTFVLQAPAGTPATFDPVANDGSASVPFDTTLVFNAGATLKLQNASLFAQNQGSAIQALGGINPNDRVTFTSYADDTVGGDTNHNGANSVPHGGDWGGVVFRNFDQAGRTDTFPVDRTLVGPGGGAAIAGENDTMSSLNYATIRYGGGAVPQTQGTRFDEVTLYNSRPSLTNDTITGSAPGDTSGGSQAGISGDFNSFREDDVARGPLVRRTTVTGTSLNGIWVRPSVDTGVAQANDAVPLPANPVTLGGVQNYAFADPLPYILTSVLRVGTSFVNDTPATVNNVMNRLYIQPGMMVKSEPGAGIQVITAGASMIVGDRTYITGWDALATRDPTGLPTSTYGPTTPGFVPNTTGDANVLFTSALDNVATTSYFDPLTQQTTIIVPAIDSLNSGGIGQPSPGGVPTSSRWASVNYQSGSFGTFDEATLRYGGTALNVPGGSLFPGFDVPSGVLNFVGASGGSFSYANGQFVFNGGALGTRLMVTNNTFTDNLDVPMSINPDGLYAADTLRPLSSGAPFFRGNIFQRNGANALLVMGTHNDQGHREVSNVNVNSLWDSTDLTYLVRDSIVMGGPDFAAPVPGSTTSFAAEPKPTVVLTIQSALPGTLEPNGQTIPRPGESVIVKLDSKGGGVPAPTEAFTTTANTGAEIYAGAGFIAGVDNGVDPPADPLPDVGVNTQMRFLGIGGNETTGQPRVPVVITSINDNTYGNTVRGVTQYSVVDGNTTAPAAGDGGLIYFGGLELPDYNALDPRDGSLIDNVDLKYLSRVEMQGGGIINYVDANASNSFDLPDDPYHTKGGAFPNLANGQPDPRDYLIQTNASHVLTITNSNLQNFRDAGVFEHPGFNEIAGGKRSGLSGEPNSLILINDTVTNAPIGVQVVGDPGTNLTGGDANEVTLLNNTFYNDPIGVDMRAIVFNPTVPQTLQQNELVALDNIFDGSTTTPVQVVGQAQGSIMEYNLFFNDGHADSNYVYRNPAGPPVTGFSGQDNFFEVLGDPQFRNPATGNFQLEPTSPAIDAARSELDLSLIVSAGSLGFNYSGLVTTVAQVLNATGGVRIPVSRNDGLFYNDPNAPQTDELTLPGYTNRGFIDEWVPTLPSDPQAIPGPTTVAGTWEYKPALIPPGTAGAQGGGQRDQLGNLRQDDPNKPNVGFGTLPFFDIGAYEYRIFFPPHVTAVTASVPSGTISLYKAGGNAGTNQPIQTINIQFDHSLDPTTVNGATVLLEASGGDGIFGNNNSAADKFYNLSGKVSFNSTTNVLTINVGAAGLTLGSDKYRLYLLGTGANVIRDPQGNTLDGEDTSNNDDPNGTQLPLPSGDGFPGGNFYDTFVINTSTPVITAGSFALAPQSDSGVVGDNITANNKPSFTGAVSVTQPAIDPLAGQTVILDVSTRGDGVFDRLNAGTALSDANGNFVVTVGQDGAATGLVTNVTALPDSPYSVGPDGRIGTADDSGYSLFRIRVIDTAGNVSNQPTDPIQSFLNSHALTGAIIDTAPPTITSFAPTPDGLITPTSSGITFTFTTNKNIAPASLSAASILVTRAGPDGVLGTRDDVSVPVNASTITTRYLGGGRLGPEQVTFQVTGTQPNDLYAVILKGTGTAPITDVAGNPLDGQFTGTFPSGADGKPGSDFNPRFVVFSPSNLVILYVGASYGNSTSAARGARQNPYSTIAAAITASAAGDVIAVLPGYYTENIVLKPFTRLVAASLASTDSALVLNTNPLATGIRAPASFSTTAENVTVSASNLATIAGVSTEVAGFTISSPLRFDPALGPIDPATAAVEIVNSNVLLDHDYIIDSHIGVHVVVTGTAGVTPTIVDDGIIGNDVGIVVDDKGATVLPTLTQVINNTVALNTVGLLAVDSPTSLILAQVANNIFWENHDQTAARSGTGISSTVPNKLVVANNLFQGNGPSETNPADDAVNVGNGFSAANLKATPDVLGNFTGNPAFITPTDPRPGSDGPATFFLDANYSISSASAAIDAANNALAPSLDLIYNGRVRVAGRGFPGTGPADVGAFEFQNSTGGGGGGSGGGGGGGFVGPGHGFVIASDSLSNTGAKLGGGAVYAPGTAPTSVTVAFSAPVDRASLDLNDLALTGDGLNANFPARAAGLTWVDPETVRVSLSGGFSNQGTVVLSLPAGSARSTGGVPLDGFTDTFKIKPVVTTATPSGPATVVLPVATTANPTAAAVGATAVSLTPAPAASPVAPVAPHPVHLGRPVRPVHPVHVTHPTHPAHATPARRGTFFRRRKPQ